MNRPPKWCFITWRLASCAKPKLILWLWEKIRKSWYACLHTVMFCHGWQNKAASSHGWLVVAGHVTLRKPKSGIPRLFLFSYNGTKITPALRKMPFTNLRHTIGTGDLFHKQTIIYSATPRIIYSLTYTSSPNIIIAFLTFHVILHLSQFDLISIQSFFWTRFLLLPALRLLFQKTMGKIT